MFNRLFFRLFLAIWLVSAGILTVAGLYINFTLDEAFAEYIRSAEEREMANISESINEIIQANFDNDADNREVMHTLHHLSTTHNTRIVLQDTDNNIFYDSGESPGTGPRHQDTMNHMHDAMRGPMRGPMNGPMDGSPGGPSPGNGTNETNGESEKINDLETEKQATAQQTFAFNLEVDGTQAGEIILVPRDRGAEFLTPPEMEFIAQLTGIILAGGMIALVVSALVSALMSFSISRPVQKLKQSAETLKTGTLSERAPVMGPEELKQLAHSFNAMAESIEQTNHLKEKLTQDLSHELRNPVASIRGYLEAFQDGILSPDKDNLQLTLEELERLDNLTEEMHQLALVNFQQVQVKKTPINLIQLGNQAAKSAHAMAAGKAIDFQLQLPSEAIYVVGDEKLLLAAVNNLLKNAVHHTETGSIELAIYQEKEKNRAIIAVSDTGPGIPAEKLPYIFERFYRVDEARDRKSGGSGLGLALVKEWIKSMGGDVEVSSTEGVGSTFKLNLPLQE